jgi:hypothetical protein
VVQPKQNETSYWNVTENVRIGSGVEGKHIFRFKTSTPLPFNVEINVSAKYLKGGRAQSFEIPGKDKILVYRLVNRQ